MNEEIRKAVKKIWITVNALIIGLSGIIITAEIFGKLVISRVVALVLVVFLIWLWEK